MLNLTHPFPARLYKMTMVQPKKGFPKLRGRAADMASLDKTMLALWDSLMDQDNTQHKQIKLFLEIHHQLCELLDEFSPRFGFTAVPNPQAQQCFMSGLQMAQLHAVLENHFKGLDRKLFNLTSKTHFVLHSLQLCEYIHRKMIWCFKGESTMHRLQTLWKSCLHGSKHYQVGQKAALKERHLLWLKHKVSSG